MLPSKIVDVVTLVEPELPPTTRILLFRVVFPGTLSRVALCVCRADAIVDVTPDQVPDPLEGL